MTNNRGALVLSVVFLCVAFVFIFYQRIHKPRVFVLHSYSANMPWVKSLNRGVRQVFADKQYVSVRYFYMDSKRRTTPHYLKRTARAAFQAVLAWQPDIVLVFDDNAQKLVGRDLAKKTNLKVIFGGVTDNHALHPMAKLDNVTGVLEEIPVKAIKEVLGLIFHRKKRIYYLSDDSPTAKALEKTILASHWGSYQLVAHKRVKTVEQWKEAVIEAGQKADVLLVSVYHTLKESKKRVAQKRLVKWMNQHAKVPVVGIYESFIVDGGLIAIAVPSLEQGYTAAWLAHKIIEKKVDIAKTPFIKSKTFSLYLRKKGLKRRFPQAHIPVILSAFSKTHWNLNEDTPPELSLSSIHS